ncbi:mannitol dehydrogenase family protein [Sphingomonas sp.]|uniref:mannitol dehydrogenase family protein n=1 Tax=Sphingomonas sp. TaxID=28214 RepID=UPI002DD63752|nr:mannitol dehydrogenase family protein [Sphingomonas sp.]
MTGRLSAATLDKLPGDVARPGYDPAAHGVGIVHLGIGAFHRAHQAAYVDDVLAAYGGDWRILGVSLRSPGVRDQLAPQDGLYTLIERDADGDRPRVIGAVAGVIVAREEAEAAIAAIADPATHIVSLTVTEKGYCHDPATGRLDAANPAIVADLASGMPMSAIGLIAAGLARRRIGGAGPVTLLSCDNLPHNGAVLAAVLADYLALADPALADWVAANVRCPATMIDRIVPATTDADRDALAARLGARDEGMVKAERFTQWVIEDDFAGPRPRLEDVGVQFVADVRPFELAKLRMLNGAHSTIAYLGLAAGHETVDRAVADPAIRATAERLMRAEAAPTLPPVAGLDPDAYAADLLDRFANPALGHRLIQIAMDGSQKLPQRLLGTIVDCRRLGIHPAAAVRGVAGWMAHVRRQGAALDDPMAAQLATLAVKAADDAALVDALLGVRAIFGDLAGDPWLRAALGSALAEVR